MAKRKPHEAEPLAVMVGDTLTVGEAVTAGEVVTIGQPVDLTVDWPSEAVPEAVPVSPDYKALLKRVLASPDVKACPICGQRLWAGHLPGCELLAAIE